MSRARRVPRLTAIALVLFAALFSLVRAAAHPSGQPEAGPSARPAVAPWLTEWLTPDVDISECGTSVQSGRVEEVLQAGDLLVEEALLLEVGCC